MLQSDTPREECRTVELDAQQINVLILRQTNNADTNNVHKLLLSFDCSCILYFNTHSKLSYLILFSFNIMILY